MTSICLDVFSWVNSDLISFIGVGFCLSLIIPDELVLKEISASNYSCKIFQMQITWTHIIPPVAQAYAMYFSNTKMHYSTLGLILIGTTLFCFLLPLRKLLSAYATGWLPWNLFWSSFKSQVQAVVLSFCPAGNNITRTNQTALSQLADKWPCITRITVPLLIHSWLMLKNKLNY